MNGLELLAKKIERFDEADCRKREGVHDDAEGRQHTRHVLVEVPSTHVVEACSACADQDEVVSTIAAGAKAAGGLPITMRVLDLMHILKKAGHARVQGSGKPDVADRHRPVQRGDAKG